MGTERRMKIDQCQYIRDYYGVPAQIGGVVKIGGKFGTIKQADHYIHVQFMGVRGTRPYHPTDGVEYLVDEVKSGD